MSAGVWFFTSVGSYMPRLVLQSIESSVAQWALVRSVKESRACQLCAALVQRKGCSTNLGI